MEGFSATIAGQEVASFLQETAMSNISEATADDQSSQDILFREAIRARSAHRDSSRNRRNSRSSSPNSSSNRISKRGRSPARSVIPGKQRRGSPALKLIAQSQEQGEAKVAKEYEDVVMQDCSGKLKQTLEEVSKDLKTEVKIDQVDVEEDEAGTPAPKAEDYFATQQLELAPYGVQPGKLALPIPVNDFTALSQLFSNLLSGYELSETDFAWLFRYIDQLEPQDADCRDMATCLSNILLVEQEARQLGDTIRIPAREFIDLEQSMRVLQQNLLSRLLTLQGENKGKNSLVDRGVTPNIEVAFGRFEDQDEVVNRIITEGFSTRINTMSLNYLLKLVVWETANDVTPEPIAWEEGPGVYYAAFEDLGKAFAEDPIERGNLSRKESSAIMELKELIERPCLKEELQRLRESHFYSSTLVEFLIRIDPTLGLVKLVVRGFFESLATATDSEKQGDAWRRRSSALSFAEARFEELCNTCPIPILFPPKPELEAGKAAFKALSSRLQVLTLDHLPAEPRTLDILEFCSNAVYPLNSESFYRLKDVLDLLNYTSKNFNPRLVLHLFWQYLKDRGVEHSKLLDFKLLVQLLLRNDHESGKVIQRYKEVLEQLKGLTGGVAMDCEYARKRIIIDHLASEFNETRFELQARTIVDVEKSLLHAISERILGLAREHVNLLSNPFIYDIDGLVKDLHNRPLNNRPISRFPDAEDLSKWIQSLNNAKFSEKIMPFISKGDPTNSFYQVHQIVAVLTGKLQYDNDPESEIFKHCEGLEARWKEICSTYLESPVFLKGRELEAGDKLIAALSSRFAYFVREVARERSEAEVRLDNLTRLKERMDRLVENGNVFVDKRSPDHRSWNIELEGGLYNYLRFILKHDSNNKRLLDLQLLFAVLLNTSCSDIWDVLMIRWKHVNASLKPDEFVSEDDWDSFPRRNMILEHLYDKSLKFFVFDLLQRDAAKRRSRCLADLLRGNSRDEIRRLALKQEELVMMIFDRIGEWIQLLRQVETQLALDLKDLALTLSTLEKKEEEWDPKIFEWISAPKLLDHPLMKPLVEYLRGLDPTGFLFNNYLPAVFEEISGRDVTDLLSPFPSEKISLIKDADRVGALIELFNSEYDLRIKWRKVMSGEEGYNFEDFYAQLVFDELKKYGNKLHQLIIQTPKLTSIHNPQHQIDTSLEWSKHLPNGGDHHDQSIFQTDHFTRLRDLRWKLSVRPRRDLRREDFAILLVYLEGFPPMFSSSMGWRWNAVLEPITRFITGEDTTYDGGSLIEFGFLQNLYWMFDSSQQARSQAIKAWLRKQKEIDPDLDRTYRVLSRAELSPVRDILLKIWNFLESSKFLEDLQQSLTLIQDNDLTGVFISTDLNSSQEKAHSKIGKFVDLVAKPLWNHLGFRYECGPFYRGPKRTGECTGSNHYGSLKCLRYEEFYGPDGCPSIWLELLGSLEFLLLDLARNKVGFSNKERVLGPSSQWSMRETIFFYSDPDNLSLAFSSLYLCQTFFKYISEVYYYGYTMGHNVSGHKIFEEEQFFGKAPDYEHTSDCSPKKTAGMKVSESALKEKEKVKEIVKAIFGWAVIEIRKNPRLCQEEEECVQGIEALIERVSELGKVEPERWSLLGSETDKGAALDCQQLGPQNIVDVQNSSSSSSDTEANTIETTRNKKRSVSTEEGDDVNYHSGKRAKPLATKTLSYSISSQEATHGLGMDHNNTGENALGHPQLASIRLWISEHAERFRSEDGMDGSSDYLVTCFNRTMLAEVARLTPPFKPLHTGLEKLLAKLSGSWKHAPVPLLNEFENHLNPLNLYLLYSFQSERDVWCTTWKNKVRVRRTYTLKRDSAIRAIWNFIVGGDAYDRLGPGSVQNLHIEGEEQRGAGEEKNGELYQVMGLLRYLLDYVSVKSEATCVESICERSFEDHESGESAVHCSGMKILLTFNEILEARLQEKLHSSGRELAFSTSFDEELSMTESYTEAPSVSNTASSSPLLLASHQSPIFPEGYHSTPFLAPTQLPDQVQPSPLILPPPAIPQPTRPVTFLSVEANQHGYYLESASVSGSWTHNLSLQAPTIGEPMDLHDYAEVRTAAENLMALTNDDGEDVDFSAFLMDISDEEDASSEATIQDDGDVEMGESLVENPTDREEDMADGNDGDSEMSDE